MNTIVKNLTLQAYFFHHAELCNVRPPRFCVTPHLQMGIKHYPLTRQQIIKLVVYLSCVTAYSYTAQVVLKDFQVPPVLRQVLGPNDLSTLDQLCTMHNNIQALLVSVEQERQEVLMDATQYEIGVTEVTKQLHNIRYHLSECIQIALKRNVTPSSGLALHERC